MRFILLFASFSTLADGLAAHDLIPQSEPINAVGDPIPQPDPIRLAAARDMVNQLPIMAVCLSRYGPCQNIGERAKKWLDKEAVDVDDDVRRVFALKARETAIEVTPEVEAQVKEQLAKHYAFAMTAPELTETTRFLASDAGQSYSRASVVRQPIVARLWNETVYNEVSPKFAVLLDDAKDTARLMRAVNKGQRGRR